MKLRKFCFTGVNLPMAFSAKTYQVGRGVVKFVAIFVMNMKMTAPLLPSFFALLASPSVSIFNRFTNSLPVVGIIPVCNSTLPRGVVLAPNPTTKYEGFGLGAGINPKAVHKLLDRSGVNSALRSNIGHRSEFVQILHTKPAGIFVFCIRAIVSIKVQVPLIFSLVPFNRRLAPAFTKRWIADRGILDRLASFTARMGLFRIPGFNAISSKNVANCLGNNAPCSGKGICPDIFPSRGRGNVGFTDLMFLVWRKLGFHKPNFSTVINGGQL